MTPKQKLFWMFPYAVLFAVAAVAGRQAISASDEPAAANHRIHHAMVNWNAVQAEPDPSARAIAAYD